MTNRKLTITFLLLFALVFSFPPQALAYLDPGSGSYFFQLLLALVLGGLYTLKGYWRKVMSRLKERFSKKGRPQI